MLVVKILNLVLVCTVSVGQYIEGTAVRYQTPEILVWISIGMPGMDTVLGELEFHPWMSKQIEFDESRIRWTEILSRAIRSVEFKLPKINENRYNRYLGTGRSTYM